MSSIFGGSKFVQRPIREARAGAMASGQLVRRLDLEASLEDANEARQPITERDAEASQEVEAMPDCP